MAIVALFVHRNRVEAEAKLQGDIRRLEACFRRIGYESSLVPSDGKLPFPACLEKWEFIERHRLFFVVNRVPDIRTAAPNTILSESKARYDGGNLVLMVDGTIAIRAGDGTMKLKKKAVLKPD